MTQLTPVLARDKRPPLATTQVLLLCGLMVFALLLTLYYLFALRVDIFTDQTHTLYSGGWIVVPISGFCVAGVICALRLNIISFPVIFISSCFLFNLGKFVYFILETVHTSQWPIPNIPQRYYVEALPVVGISFTAFLIGTVIASFRYEKRRTLHRNHTPTLDLYSDSATILRHIGYALYIVAIGFTIYYALRGTGLALAIRYGYATRGGEGYAAATAAGQMPLLATASLFWFMPWASFILLTTARGRREQIFVIGLAMCTCVFTLLAGDRFVPISIFVGILSIGYLRGQKLRLWRVALVLLVTFFIISTWSQIRIVSIQDWDASLFAETATNAATGEYNTAVRGTRQLRFPISGVFRQLGQSYLITPGMIKLIDDGEPYHYGLDYIRMIGSAIPLTNAYLDSWRPTPSGWFDDQYVNADSLRGLGFSIIAEAYLQGGVTAVVIVHIILGFGITAIWFRLERRPTACGIAYMMIVISAAYIWVRDDMTELSRPIVWGGILVFIIPSIIIHAMRQSQIDIETGDSA